MKRFRIAPGDLVGNKSAHPKLDSVNGALEMPLWSDPGHVLGAHINSTLPAGSLALVVCRDPDPLVTTMGVSGTWLFVLAQGRLGWIFSGWVNVQ